jgi:hypothetical protein
MRLVSEESLLERRKGHVRAGEDSVYGIPVVSHGAACSATRAT